MSAAAISSLVLLGIGESSTINDFQVFLQPVIKNREEKVIPKVVEQSVIDDPFVTKKESEVQSKEGTTSIILLDVPFTSQAPFGEWKDERQQDGCEETSALMAVAWASGEKLSRDGAKKEILAIAEYEKNKYGSFVDTDAKDTVDRIIFGYFNYEKARAIDNITIDNIKTELYKGSLVLVPCNGRRLGNPNYTPPGPERHMLVIRGYDPIKKEFITNDAGTRKGKAYRYKEDILYKAIVDYPTGNHVPIKVEIKAMIVVWK